MAAAAAAAVLRQPRGAAVALGEYLPIKCLVCLCAHTVLRQVCTRGLGPSLRGQGLQPNVRQTWLPTPDPLLPLVAATILPGLHSSAERNQQPLGNGCFELHFPRHFSQYREISDETIGKICAQAQARVLAEVGLVCGSHGCSRACRTRLKVLAVDFEGSRVKTHHLKMLSRRIFMIKLL
ncbi:hypothetical protein H920_02873 [Fukomys damarensis]|uniref:Uncharacterized protein n=1 Tax=Fukomys damarensis TaxID=885580 RepID=A0A091DU46_FUKDA|nr:hypothetical protein H920_02873 [Fukomys damarensis]